MQEEIKITKVPDVVTFKDKLFQLETESHELIFSLNVIVKNEQISEDSDDYITVFSYPPKENNFLHKLKGSFLTIASIMKNTFNIYPRITNIKVHNTIFYVTYTIRNGGNEFIFLGFNSNYGGSFDATHLTKNFVKFLDYIYPNFIIMNDFEQLNSFCEIVKMQLIKKNSDAINFEQLFSCVKFVSLPKEIVLRINDALSELEAMDYRNWNESLMELFGKFSIIGSCLYFKNSLICSHFNEIDLENVDLFIRHMCLKFMFERCILKEVAIWQRVYPREYQSYNMENDSTKNKVFLLIVSNGNLIMCVLLEENSFNINPENIESQSSNYLINFLFEMKDVLDHLKMVGIENLAKIWINSAKRPLCKNPFEPEISKKNQLQLKNIKEESEDDESDRDFDSHIDGQSTRQSSSGGFENEDLIYKDFEDIIPQTLTFGADNVLFHFTNLDFKEGIMITSLCEKYSIPPNDLLVDIFRRGCLNIHNKLQNTIKFNQILSRENRISNNNKTAMLPKEQAMLCEVKWEKGILNFWIIGRLFGIKELYVCHDARTPQNMVEIAFRLAINCCG
ncbi:hypothetical protein PVAND_006768 [Polypedilum vanderplanki]|nr:hypothetical protein PVAND_006768 [Polypedilum vanderplanki]